MKRQHLSGSDEPANANMATPAKFTLSAVLCACTCARAPRIKGLAEAVIKAAAGGWGAPLVHVCVSCNNDGLLLLWWLTAP